MHIAEALGVRVLIVDGLGTGHQNAQTSKTISSALVYIRFFFLTWAGTQKLLLLGIVLDNFFAWYLQ